MTTTAKEEFHLADEIIAWREDCLQKYMDILVKKQQQNTDVTSIDFIVAVQGLRQLGIADKTLAEEIGITQSTLELWLKSRGRISPQEREITLHMCIAIVKKYLLYENSQYSTAMPKMAPEDA